tara:strand:+ start:7329 stop:7748 length:420 start_codon:yes stop_codon:yes gene_type:complete
MSYQMVKLSNGEDIICNVESDSDLILQISSPLKMETYSRTTEKGMVESLGLSRWIQPYSDEELFTIQKNTIVMMTPVSAGLQKYYEYVLKSMDSIGDLDEGPTEKEIRVIEKEEERIEDLEKDLDEMEAILDKQKSTIH